MTETDELEQEEGPEPQASEAGSDSPAEAAADEQEESLGPDYRAARNVVERNGYFGNTIFVGGDFNDGGDESSRTAIPVVDITEHVDAIDGAFVEPPTFQSIVKAIGEHGMALLVGSECGNRMAGTMALRRAGHEPIVELPGALSVSDLVQAVDRACSVETTGVLVDSVDPDTLIALAGFHLRHLRDVIPPKSALVLTSRKPRTLTLAEPELPAIEGAPPDGERLLRSLAERRELAEDALARAEKARELLPGSPGPADITQLVELASGSATAEDLAAAIAGRSRLLDEWLEGEPDAKSLAAVAAAATLDGVPSVDYDDGAKWLAGLLEGEVEPSTDAPRFSAKERAWPAGLAVFRREQVMTYFGWEEAEIVEICAPHQHDVVVLYLWSHLGGEFRRPFLDWLRELPQTSNDRLAFAAARTAGVLFAADPLVIERELLRPWAMDGSGKLRRDAGFALGMPAVIGADPTSARRLLKQWATSRSPQLRQAAIVTYGGPLGIWDPSAAAVSRLWEMPWTQGDLLDLANRSLAGLLIGGREGARARAATVQLLVARVESGSEAPRVFSILPLAFNLLSGGGKMARESLEALREEPESRTWRDLAALLAQAFDSREGRESARAAILILLGAAEGGRIGRDVVEQLIREMKEDASERGRLPQLGSQLKQLLKEEERSGGRCREIARSIHETFYRQGKEVNRDAQQ